MRKFLKRLLMIITISIVLMLAILAWFAHTNFAPRELEPLEVKNPAGEGIDIKDQMTIISWNIGYAGLGEDMDFFYDGGKGVEPPKIYYHICVNGILNQLKSFQNADFFLFQEVDINSARSYYTDQVNLLSQRFPDLQYVFARNYDVKFVPVPWHHPMGKVQAGLLTMFRYSPDSSVRISLPGVYKWPVKMFMLDRCLTYNAFPLNNGKKLILINTHNEAFDDGGMRVEQLNKIKSILLKEFQEGNYLIAGGDWNQNPPGFSADLINDGNKPFSVLPAIDTNFLPGEWKWVFQNKTPSNRKVDQHYVMGRTETTVIDFFVVSPNVKVLSVKTHPYNFRYSDHNPVEMKFELIK